MSPPDRVSHRPLPGRVLTWLGVTVLSVLIAATAVGFLGRTFWIFDLAAALRVHYALGFLVLLVLFASMRRRWLLTASALGLVTNLALIVPLYVSGSGPAAADAPVVRVMFLNTQIRGADVNELIEDLTRGESDLVFLSAATDAWADALGAADIPYSVAQSRPRGTSLELLLLARHGVNVETRLQNFGGGGRSMAIEARVTLGDASVQVLAMHPVSPATPERAAAHREQIEAIAGWARGQDDPVVVVGDLNATPWSSVFQMLLEDGDLVNSQEGFGIHASWPASLGPLGIPIDHVLHSQGLTTVERSLGPGYGSEHRSIHAAIAAIGSD
jgi:endonuclease/exonuclease/phosphatase (EEP) superfamily protein YafD